MNAIGLFVAEWLGRIVFLSGLVMMAVYPLVMSYPEWERRLLKRRWKAEHAPRVSVIIPAYNEERTVALSIQSVLRSDYPNFEVIVVNDGSTDDTAGQLAPFIDAGQIRYFAKPNGGKASALNLGLAEATGEIVLFTDADTMFTRQTIACGVRYFVDPAIGAVAGNDTPLTPRGPLQKMLVVTSHIGTGFVRRALSIARVLPIIPGNLGLVRTEILRRVGGFREVWGEDLELTFRLHRHGVRIVYGAQTMVVAECPHTLTGLWKQRVRWVRSYIKILRLHADMVGNPRFGGFGIYLAILSFAMIAVPALQVACLVLLPLLVATGHFTLHGFEWLLYFGFASLLGTAIYAIALDGRLRDAFYLPYLVLLVPLSFFYNAIVLYSIYAELRARPEQWNKLGRRGVTVAEPADATRRQVALGLTAFTGLAGAGITVRAHDASGPRDIELAVAIHFPDWPHWPDAIASVADVAGHLFLDRVAVSAGRADWTYFRWPGHESWWSTAQAREPRDILETAIQRLTARGIATSAVLDVFAARYLERFPQYAAHDVDGEPSEDIVCSTWMAEGAYGALLTQACAALAQRSGVDSICITELQYDRHCFDARCLAAFRRATGARDWPRRHGKIDPYDPALGEWRSRQVAGIVARLAEVSHAQGKRLLLDVKVSRPDFHRNGREYGQDYALLLAHADELVVWDYFGLHGVAPRRSEGLASYLARTIGPARYWHSIGLWGEGHRTISAHAMREAIDAAVDGGARKIWVTPGRQLGKRHWEELAELRPQRAPDGRLTSPAGRGARGARAALLASVALVATEAAPFPLAAQTNAGGEVRTGLTLQEQTERQVRNYRWDDAIRTYRAMVAADPEDVDAWRQLGQLLRWDGRLDESREAYEHATALAPDNVDAALGLAASYRYAHDFVTAQRLFDDAGQRWPDDASVIADRRSFARERAPRIDLFYEDDLSFKTRSAGIAVPLFSREEFGASWQREERPDAYVRHDVKATYQHFFGLNQVLTLDARFAKYDYANPVTDPAAIEQLEEYRIRYSHPITPEQVVTIRYSFRPTRLQLNGDTFNAHKLEAQLRSQWTPRLATVVGTGLLRDLDDGAQSGSDLRTTSLVRAGVEYALTPRLQLSANYITNPDLDNTVRSTILAQGYYNWSESWATLYRLRQDDYKRGDDQTAHYLGMRYNPGGHVWAEAGLKYVTRGDRNGVYPLVSLVYRF